MTSLRFVLVLALLSLASCSDDKPAPAATDAALVDAVVDSGSADATESGVCTADSAMRMCTGESASLTGPLTRTWSGCADGKEYVLACGDVGADGQRDCTCKADGATIGSFRSVTPDRGEAGGTAWPNLFACYCGVLP